ncbi:MAG: FxDxF family PEP-CTERM protein [Novosphingobium sp.]
MKLLASLAAAAVLSVGSTAYAAPTISYTAASPDFSAYFGNSPVAGSFNDTFTPFTITQAGLLVGSLTTKAVSAATNINFTSAFVSGPNGPFAFTLSGPGVTETGDLGGPTGFSILPGTYTLHVLGTNGLKGSYAGTLAFTANVPEPASWALMILGVGAIGFAMRGQRAAVRGNAQYRLSYS